MTKGIPPFQAFLEEHRSLVYRFLVVAAGPNEADDCFQETFLAALRAYPSLRHGENLRSWVMTIAANKAVDAGRSRRRRPVAVGDAPEISGAGREDPGPVDPDEPLWRAVRGLPERQRTAVVLRSVLDRPYAEIAGVMGCSEETARANVHQGLKRLRADLAEGKERVG